MTPDQIEQMAREAGLLLGGHMCGRCNEYAWPDEETFRFAQAVRAAALEEAAKVCDRQAAMHIQTSYECGACEKCAEEIRSLIPLPPTPNQGTPE